MGKDKPGKGLWLGGIAIGAGLMYLLDPTHGAARRDAVGRWLGDAASRLAGREAETDAWAEDESMAAPVLDDDGATDDALTARAPSGMTPMEPDTHPETDIELRPHLRFGDTSTDDVFTATTDGSGETPGQSAAERI